MKLSDLVHYKNQLEKLSSNPTLRTATTDLNIITHLCSTQAIQVGNFAEDLEKNQTAIADSFRNFETTLDQLKAELKQLIESSEKPWFQESYRLYEIESPHETVDYILDRQADISDETEKFFHTRLARYTDWHYPAMIIRPGRETFIQSMVACDPLYLVDDKHELLAPAMNLYNETYQRRLRPYVVKDSIDEDILTKLPNGQFGLIFAYNFFNFKPLEVIKKYFEEIYTKLRPGGAFVFTFNDCDRAKGVVMVEQHFCCYTPGGLLRDLAESIGFETAFSWNDDSSSTWLELKRPGELTSLRGGQTLAKIFAKSK
jgi:SAM-dependent methyltransferase